MNWRPLRDMLGNRPPAPVSTEADAERAKQTADLLRRLRDTRVLAGISLSDVERDTRINRAYLEAIEDGRFDDLPAPVYARGFVRSYSRYLGLDPEESVAAMPDLPPPLGLEPIAGLRRTVPPVLPAVNLPVVSAIGAAILLALIAYFLLPSLGGGDGIDATPTTTAPSTVEGEGTSTPAPGEGTTTPGAPASTATVPPFEEGTAPDFTGVTRETAQATLGDLEVTPLFVDAASEAPAGLVFDQSPSPGTAIEPGDVITLFVSTGP